MKKLSRIIAITSFMVCLIAPISIFSQGDPPPPPQSGHGEQGNTPPGGGAPIGEGLLLMLTLGGVYGGFKIKKKKQ